MLNSFLHKYIIMKNTNLEKNTKKNIALNYLLEPLIFLIFLHCHIEYLLSNGGRVVVFQRLFCRRVKCRTAECLHKLPPVSGISLNPTSMFRQAQPPSSFLELSLNPKYLSFAFLSIKTVLFSSYYIFIISIINQFISHFKSASFYLKEINKKINKTD